MCLRLYRGAPPGASWLCRYKVRRLACRVQVFTCVSACTVCLRVPRVRRCYVFLTTQRLSRPPAFGSALPGLLRAPVLLF